MACLLTSGRALPCKSSVGGLKAVYFADYGTLGTTTIASGEITAVAGTPDFFKFDIKGNSSLETTINSSRENGTTFYTQTLNLTLPVLEVISIIVSSICSPCPGLLTPPAIAGTSF